MTNNPIDKARQLQRALYRAAKRSAGRRFHALYDKLYRQDILRWAWELVKANRGMAGVDHQTIQSIEDSGVDAFLHQLQEQLREGRYRPQPVKRVYIPKPDGRQRPLGIPAVRDRVVQAAVKIGILSLIVLDASVTLAVAGPVWAVPILALLAPALVLGRWVYST